MLLVVDVAIVGVTSLLQATLKVLPLSAAGLGVLTSATMLPKLMVPPVDTAQPAASVALSR